MTFTDHIHLTKYTASDHRSTLLFSDKLSDTTSYSSPDTKKLRLLGHNAFCGGFSS